MDRVAAGARVRPVGARGPAPRVALASERAVPRYTVPRRSGVGADEREVRSRVAVAPCVHHLTLVRQVLGPAVPVQLHAGRELGPAARTGEGCGRPRAGPTFGFLGRTELPGRALGGLFRRSRMLLHVTIELLG